MLEQTNHAERTDRQFIEVKNVRGVVRGARRPDVLVPSRVESQRPDRPDGAQIAPLQRTLIVLKPDCLAMGVCGKVITRFEETGFRICASKMMQLAPALLLEHYRHITAREFYPAVEQFMRSSPIIAMVVEGEDVVSRVRGIVGATDSRKASPGSVRRDFGTDAILNVAHASDSVESAEREIALFFGKDEVFSPFAAGGSDVYEFVP